MEITETIDYEERIAGLENRIKYLDALVRGISAEMLELKAAAVAMTRDDRERSRQELRTGSVVRGTPLTAPAGSAGSDESVVIIQKAPKETPAAPPEPEMVRIMQSDGTMKMEPRYGNRRMS